MNTFSNTLFILLNVFKKTEIVIYVENHQTRLKSH